VWLVISTVFIKSEALLTVAGSHVQIETLLLQTTNRKSYMAYQLVAIPVTLSDHQSHSNKYFSLDFSYSCPAVDNISTDVLCDISFSFFIVPFVNYAVSQTCPTFGLL